MRIMGATKIINVLKEDSFEEIFELFQGASADDIIFVLPKRAKIFSHPSHFSILARESEKLGKSVSIMSPNAQVNELAEKSGFAVLGGSKKNVVQATLARAQAHKPPPSDPIAHGDYEDAYGKEDREVGTSDETMGVDDPETEDEEKLEQEGMRIVEGEELKEELGGEGEEHYHEKDEEEPDKEELEEIEEDKTDKDAEFVVASDQPDRRVYRIVTASTRKMDGMVQQVGPKKHVKVPKPAEKPTKLDVRTGIDREDFVHPKEQEPEPAENDAMSQVLQSITQQRPNVSTKPVYVPGENRPQAPEEIIREKIPSGRFEKERSDTLESVWFEGQPEKTPWPKGLMEKGGSFWSRLNPFGRSKSKPAGPILPGQMLPQQPPAERQARLSKKLVVGILVVSFVVLGTIVYVTTGSATITVRPIEKKLETAVKVEASDTFAEVDPVFNKIPGQVFSMEKEVTQEFPASGEKEVAQKARGKMTISNSFGSGQQTLIATTRFQSKDGLIFRTLNSVSVPGPTVVNGKVVPGKAEVDVVADKPGASYNIPAGAFGIIAFKERGDQDRYEKITGETKAAMTGGASGLSKVVTEADFAKAKDAVAGVLRVQVDAELKSQGSGDLEFPLLPSIKDIQFTSSAQPDQAAEKFTVTAKTTLKTVGFKKQHLDELVLKFVAKSENLTVLPEKLNITYNDPVFSEEKSLLSMGVILNGPAYATIDTDKILFDLLGKTETDLREYLKTAPGVASAKVVLSPFWVSRMPKDKTKIKLEIAY